MKPNQTLVDTERQLNLVLFRLERQTYALPIEQVRQIIEMVTITPIPQVNHSVSGMINFHGMTVPVVNLRKHLGMAEQPLRLHTPIIIVNIGGRMVGLVVDEVQDVQAFSRTQLINPRAVLPEELGSVPILLGMVQTGSSMIMALDLEHLFQIYDARALFQVTDAIASQKATEPATQPAHDQAVEARLPAPKPSTQKKTAGKTPEPENSTQKPAEKPIKKTAKKAAAKPAPAVSGETAAMEADQQAAA